MSWRQQHGFSLVETLIAAGLLATALLGLSGLASRGLQDAAASRDELVAAVLLRDVEGRVAVTGGPRNWSPPVGFATAELAAWRARAAQQLPRGAGTVCRDATPEDGRAGAPGCDGLGGVVGKLFWHRDFARGAERRVLRLSP